MIICVEYMGASLESIHSQKLLKNDNLDPDKRHDKMGINYVELEWVEG